MTTMLLASSTTTALGAMLFGLLTVSTAVLILACLGHARR